MEDNITPGRKKDWTVAVGLFLLSAGILVFEINLTRLFSVAQFYHFAFLIVSIAMLGSGAGGTVLALSGRSKNPGKIGPAALSLAALGTSLAMVGSFVLVNEFPFDSFLVGQKPAQFVLLGLHYLALALPFCLGGIASGLLLSGAGEKAGRIYAANLLGSAAGCAAAWVTPAVLGGEGIVGLSSLLAVLAALVFLINPTPGRKWVALLAVFWLLFLFVDLGLRVTGGNGFAFFKLILSPYKGLSYALQAPGAEIVSQRWNAFSRVDIVRSKAIHSLPGLSYRYLEILPPEDGLFVDGDELAVLLPGGADTRFTNSLLVALAFQLRPGADTLVLDSRTGLDAVTARAQGARRIVAVEANPEIVRAVPQVYADPAVETVMENGRSYLQHCQPAFDIVIFSLTNSYHPVRSGAYSLAEDYRYTVEAFEDAMGCLKPGGLLALTRWLQFPPSESLRAFALAVAALDRQGVEPSQRLAALRSYNTALILVKKEALTSQELENIRLFAAERAFDLVYTPDLKVEETNQYNILTDPVYEQRFAELIQTHPRTGFYREYPYDVEPPTDDHPFFGHFFKWAQAREVWEGLGKTWQPFGGAGYFVVLALLGLAIVCSGILVLLPAITQRRSSTRLSSELKVLLLYFGCIGMAFMFIEMPLIQRFILYLGNPAYAVTVVLFCLLLFSGIGSWLQARVPTSTCLAVLVGWLLVLPIILPALIDLTLGASLGVRLVLAAFFLAPAGLLMGMPFPAGIQRLSLLVPGTDTPWIGWAWAVNGAASVVASVLAVLIALSAGFRLVFWIGAGFYALALLAWIRVNRRVRVGYPHP